MLKAMSFGSYIPGSSILHRSDPRTKILLTLVYILFVLIAESYLALVCMTLFCLGIALWVGMSPNHILKGVRPVVYLALFTVIAHIFSGAGPALSDSGILSFISRDGVERSLKMILKLVAMVSGTSLLTSSTTPIALTDGLQLLMLPLRHIGLPIAEIATIMSLALRFIPAIAEETEKLIKLNPSLSEGNLLKRGRACLSLLIPIFEGIVNRGDALATAMDARCFGACQTRTRMCPLRFSSADLATVGILLLFLVSLTLFYH